MFKPLAIALTILAILPIQPANAVGRRCQLQKDGSESPTDLYSISEFERGCQAAFDATYRAGQGSRYEQGYRFGQQMLKL